MTRDRALVIVPEMAQTVTGEQTLLDALSARLPKGYRARSFEETDREPFATPTPHWP